MQSRGRGYFPLKKGKGLVLKSFFKEGLLQKVIKDRLKHSIKRRF